MRRAARPLLLLGALVSLGGCVVGPNYRAPTPPAGAAGPWVSSDARLETAAEPRDDWWRLYDDARLDGYVQEAFRANADLAVAEANLAAARALFDGAQAGQFPSTTLGAGAVRGRDPATDQILEMTGREPATTWKYSSRLDVGYELDLFGRVRRAIEAARADGESVEAARDALKVTVAAETARAYAQICTLGEQIQVARHSLDIVAHEAGIAVNRRGAGAGSEFEEVRAQGLVAQVRSGIPTLEGQRRAALFQLAALLGRTPANAPAEALACTTAPTISTPVPIADGAALLRRRPDIRQADRRLAAAIARTGVATADLYPRISLAGFYGAAAPSLGVLGSERGLAWGLGPSIQWAFPNQSGPRARLRQANAGQRAALAGFDSAVLQALKETEQALSAYSAELDHHADLEAALKSARRGYEFAHDQYLAGASTQLDLLGAEQFASSAEAAVAASDALLVQDQVTIFKVLGGGWRAGA